MGKGMTAKKKGHSDRTKKYLISDKQLERIKFEVSKDATQKACLLNIAATADCFGLDEEQICKLANTVSLYASHLDNNLVKIKEVADIIEKNTGVKFSSF